MASNKPIVSLSCVNDGKGKCITAGHGGGKKAGRHEIGEDGFCRVGRLVRAQMSECPICQAQFAKNSGRVLANLRKEETPFSARNEVITQVGTNEVCLECAEFYNQDLGKGTFVARATAHAHIKKFIENFLAGASVMHRHERLGDKMRNWCDTCGCLVPIEDEESMGGVIRGNSVICLCLHCNGLAHQAMSELPSVTFFEGLEQVSTFRRPQPKPTPTAKPAKTIVRKPKASTPADELDEIEQMVDDSEEQAPAPEDDQPKPARKPAKKLVLTSIHDVFKAIVDGERVNFGRKDEVTGKTHCVVHANAPELCKCPSGLSDWDRMPTVMRGEQAFGFGAECGAQLGIHGVVLETTLKQAILAINGQEDFSQNPRPRTNFTPKAQMEFVDPKPSRAPKKRRGGGRKVSEARVTKQNASLARKNKLEDLSSQIATKRAEIVEILAQISKLELEAGNDADLLEIAREEIAGLTAKSTDLTRQVQDLNAELQVVNSTTWKDFVPKAQQVPKAEGGKKNKKDKKKNGNSKAA